MTSENDSPEDKSQAKPFKKGGYRKKYTGDLSDIKQVVNPRLRKQVDEMMKGLVDNLNRNTSEQEKDHD